MEADDLFFDVNSFILHTENEIGHGTFGHVYIVESIEDKELYAAKLLDIDEDFDGLQQMLLLRECLILNKIDHPAIVKFLGVNFRSFKSASVFKPAIITEYLKKGSLHSILSQERVGEADKNWTITKKYISLVGIASAMQYLHAHNIIHRDLKSENILLDDDLYPRICDFGLSRCLPESFTNSVNLAMTCKVGTPLYMAPELLRGDDDYNSSVDIYSFAILAYEIVSERRPYFEMKKHNFVSSILEGYRPKKMPVIPEKLWELLCKCWSGTPSERPSFEKIYEELSTNYEYLPEEVDLEEYKDYLETLAESHEELAALKKEQQRKIGLEGDVKKLAGLVKNYKEENKRITEVFEFNEKQSEEAIEALENENRELAQLVEKLKKEKGKLKEASARRDKQNEEAIAKLEAENRELKALVLKREEESAKLKEDSARRDKQNEEAIAKLEAENRELKALVLKREEESGKLAESSALREKQSGDSMAKLEREVEELTSKLSSCQKDPSHQSDTNFYLGFDSIFGPEKYRSMSEAIAHLKKSSGDGNCFSSFILGLLYETGEEVEQSAATSFSYYELSARQGYSKGLHRIGVCYANGRGVSQDHIKAFEYYRKAAEFDDASALINMGVCYENGRGVSQNYSKAIECYQKAADLGNTSGLVNLGTAYAYGKGVETDIGLYQRAIDQGDTNAMLSLGFLYECGRVRKDFAKSLECYRKAAELGSASAYKNMGAMYEQGKGVDKDYKKAMEFYQKAVELGNKKAEENLRSLQKRMK